MDATHTPAAASRRIPRSVKRMFSSWCAASLYIEALIKRGHLDLRFAKSRRECVHGILLPVRQERARRARMAVPFQQIGLIGVGREPVDRVDAGFYGDIVCKNPHRI